MRTTDRKDLISAEADQIAAEAFDRDTPHARQWIDLAAQGEWGEQAQQEAQNVLWAAIRLAVNPRAPEAIGTLRRAVSDLQNVYVDHCTDHGIYAAEAEDNINCAASDEAERLRDLQDDRQVDAYQAGIRG